MKNEELFKNFVLEIEKVKSMPNNNYYDSSDCNKKNQKILKDIDENHNWSWIKEVWERNKDNLEAPYIKYRGTNFSYKDFFAYSYKYAKALKANGVKKGEEIVCCLENTPEFPFIMGAASIIGARVNLLAADMDHEYLKNIVDNATSNLIFVSDKNFVSFSETLKMLEVPKTIIPIPLNHSLKNGNPYALITDKFYKLDEKSYNDALSSFDNIMSFDEFLAKGDNVKGKIYDVTTLDSNFTTTYTSGSTISNKPKGLVHRVRSYITMGRYHDSEISKIPSMKGMVMLSLVRTMSDTDFMSGVSDVAMQSGIVALEPINDKDFIFESLLINKPNIFLTSRSVFIYSMKKQMWDSRYKNIKLPFLICPMCIGEGLDANEEKVLNKWLRELDAGRDIIKLPTSVVCMSIAGGDSEHGGIFITMYRALLTKLFKNFGIKEPVGMSTYGMVNIKALRKDGTYCDFMEPGNLVANSPCTMEGYVNNKEGNKAFFIKDAYGKTWANLNVYGYIDKFSHVYVKGRISNRDGNIPNYKIANEILKDTKKIMSCEVVTVNDNGNVKYVAHIEPQINVSFDENTVLYSALNRCVKAFGADVLDKLYFRVRNNKESFVISPTLKRSFLALIEEGISNKCVLARDIYNSYEDLKNNKDKKEMKRILTK